MNSANDKPQKSERLRRILAFIFGFRNRHGEVLDSWLYSAENFNTDGERFYELVERTLADQKFPNVEIEQIVFAEGGLLSNQRIYLRLMRERFAIDTCAAPFGKHFFFSCRFVYVPVLVRLWHLLAAAVFFGMAGIGLVYLLGLPFAIVADIALLFAIVGVLRNAETFTGLDDLLLRIPVVSPIYEDWFRVETYYREDTRALYKNVLPDLIRRIVEDICAKDGAKLMPQDPNAPLFKGLAK